MRIKFRYPSVLCINYWIRKYQCKDRTNVIFEDHPTHPKLEFIGDDAEQLVTLFVLTWDVTTLEYFKEYHFNIYNDYTIE
jgi:hypothetical protein